MELNSEDNFSVVTLFKDKKNYTKSQYI